MIQTVRLWIVERQETILPAGSLRARFTLGAFWSVAGAVISRGFNLLASVVCARILGRTQFGELGMIQSTVGMFGVLAGLGLGLTATKYVAQFRNSDPARAGRILALSAIAALISGILMTVLLVLGASFLAARTLAAPGLAKPLALGAGLVFFGALNGAQTGALAGFEAFRTIARVNIWSGLCSFPLVVFGVWRWGVSGAICGLVGSLGINWLLNNLALRRECHRAGVFYRFRHCFREWDVLHKFTLPAFLASVVVSPALWLANTFLIHRPGGYAQLGIYTAADRWRLLILFIPTSVFGMAIPLLSNLHGTGDSAGYHRAFRLNVIFNIGIVLLPAGLIAVFAAPLMSIYGPSFRAGWPVLVILAFSAIPESLNTALGHPLVVSNRMWWRFFVDLIFVGLLVAAAWFLIPAWGAAGLALSYGLAFSGAVAGLVIYLQRCPVLKES
jgi:O-antigen/teichoic acid export membrane protein